MASVVFNPFFHLAAIAVLGIIVLNSGIRARKQAHAGVGAILAGLGTLFSTISLVAFDFSSIDDWDIVRSAAYLAVIGIAASIAGTLIGFGVALQDKMRRWM